MKRKAANVNKLRWMKKDSIHLSKLSGVLFLLCFCVAAITATVFACGWGMGNEHSVRFSSYRTVKEFGGLPHLERYGLEQENRLFSWDPEDDYENEKKKEGELEKLWKDSIEAETQGNLATVQANLKEYLYRTAPERYARRFEPGELQKRRNSAFDKLDALASLAHGSSATAVQKYLLARSICDQEAPSLRVLEPLSDLKSDHNLRDNVAYLEAAILYWLGNENAADAFAKVAEKFPKSEKREAALFMYAVCLMKQSKSWAADNNNICEDCRDESWRKAHIAYERVLHDYPQGRYFADAQGWLAYLYLKIGDRVNALATYYRMLGSKNEGARVEALFSLNFVRNHATEEEMSRLESTIAGEPSAALAYAYHNIYNYGTFRVYSWVDEQAEQNRKKDNEYRRIANFATKVVHRYPQNATAGSFLVRVAEANLELNNYVEAARLARRALSLDVKGEYRAEALWVAGFSEFQLKQYNMAKAALTTLVEENPNNRYTEGGRRNLAMLLEDMGDPDGALEQYLALDYRHDIAYFNDVLMTPEHLATFIEKHPNLKQREELVYALAIRYLRDFRWAEARQTLSSIRPTSANVDEEYFSKFESYSYYEERTHMPVKGRDFNDAIRGIRPQWIEQDLRTINDLERLEREYNAAPDGEPKAEALYQFASYIYQNHLLFYNPLAWSGGNPWRGGNRHYLLYDLYYQEEFRQPGEAQRLFEYMKKHDMASRALEIYLDVVKKYPNTKAARDALYTAAVCHERLREYNNYWRDIYADGGHAGDRMVTYADVNRTYPDYKFPLGTFGWEPMTRTVNGGPGWAVPPKPKPRPPQPTFRQRALAKLKGVAKSTLKMMRKSLRRAMKMTMRFWRYTWAYCLAFLHCLWVGFSFSTLCVVFRQAQQARRRLREEMTRFAPLTEEHNGVIAEAGNEQKIVNTLPEQKGLLAFALKYGLILPQAAETDLPSLSITDETGLYKARFGNFLRDDLRDKWQAQLREFFLKANQIRGDANGRSALILTITTYSLCFFLLVNLLLSL